MKAWTSQDCNDLAARRLQRDDAHCRDLTGVMLTKVMGARENYINSCLAGLVDTEVKVSQKCGATISFNPSFDSFEWARSISRKTISKTTSMIVDYCRSTGAHIRWINKCGPIEHFNTCITQFTWWFEYVSRVQKI